MRARYPRFAEACAYLMNDLDRMSDSDRLGHRGVHFPVSAARGEAIEITGDASRGECPCVGIAQDFALDPLRQRITARAHLGRLQGLHRQRGALLNMLFESIKDRDDCPFTGKLSLSDQRIDTREIGDNTLPGRRGNDDVGEADLTLVCLLHHDRHDLIGDFPRSIQLSRAAHGTRGIHRNHDIAACRSRHVDRDIRLQAAVHQKHGITLEGGIEERNGDARPHRFCQRAVVDDDAPAREEVGCSRTKPHFQIVKAGIRMIDRLQRQIREEI